MTCILPCKGYTKVAWDLCWGGCRRAKHCVFPCKVAAIGVRSGCGSFVLTFFLPQCKAGFKALWVRACVCVCVCAIVGNCRVFWNLGLQIRVDNGCLIVVMLCCHVRRSCFCAGFWAYHLYSLSPSRNSATGSSRACTHGPVCRTAHESSIDEYCLIYNPKATAAPPRACTIGGIIVVVSSCACSGTVEMSVLWDLEQKLQTIPMSIDRVRFDPPRIVDLPHPWNLGCGWWLQLEDSG